MFARRCRATPLSPQQTSEASQSEGFWACGAKSFCRSSDCLFLPVAGSPNLLTRPPSPFCSLGELSSFVVRSWSPYHRCRPIQLSISTRGDTHKHSVSHSHSQHLSPSHTNTHALKYPSPLINGRAGEGARQGRGGMSGEERKGEERRGEERRGCCCSCGFGVGSAAPCCPLSPSPLWLLRGHTPWPGPRNQGVRTRLRGRKRGTREGKEGYHKRKRKTGLT